MPRIAEVSTDELLEALLLTKDVILANGAIPGPKQHIWLEVSFKLNNKIRPQNVYQRLKENRDGLYDKICKRLGISTTKPEDFPTQNVDGAEDEDSSFSVEEQCYRNEKLYPSKTFIVKIPEMYWQRMRPVQTEYKRKDRNCLRKLFVLPPYIWEDYIAELLWDQHKIPCPYSFKKGRVQTDPYERRSYVTVEAVCSECGAEAKGYIFNEPLNNEPVTMEWRTEDTREMEHTKKRQLRGEKRIEIGRKIANSSSVEFRRQSARQLMDERDVEPPTLYSNQVLRKAKQNYNDTTSGVIHGPDPITCLEIMKHEQPHCGSIHDIGSDKFFVHYFSPSQLQVYRQHWRAKHVVLSIDATGSLVRKILRPHGPSQVVFLYEIVMNTGENCLPVLQMLSEKHDANSILYWLNEWERCGAPCPKEVVIDNSPALKSAVCRSFGRAADVQEYKDTCFLYLTNESSKLPPCYIRLDVAHFLKAASNWRIWREKSMKRIKDFYIRCLGLMIKSKTIDEFKESFYHTLTVSLSPEEGIGSDGAEIPMEKSLKFLTDKIKGSTTLEYLPGFEQEITDEVEENLCSDETLNEIEEKCHKVKDWVNKIYQKSLKESKKTGSRVNPYYSVEVAAELVRLASDFTLWSAVMVRHFQSPNETASSAAVEGNFNDIKNNILRGLSKPMHVHKFVDKHLNSISGAFKIGQASLNKGKEGQVHGNIKKVEEISIHHDTKTRTSHDDIPGRISKENEKEQDIKEEEVDEEEEEKENYLEQEEISPFDLNTIENWRNKARKAIPKSRKSKYLTNFPELNAAIHADKFTPPKQRLLKNGNLLRNFIKLDKTFVKIKNTCAFDALTAVISNAYIEFENYRAFIDSSENKLLLTSKSLATVGATKETYKLRAEAICSVTEPTGQLPGPSSLNNFSKINESLEYDCWTNATTFAKNILKDVPSVEIEIQCNIKTCKREKYISFSVLDTDPSTIAEYGFPALVRAIGKSQPVLPTCTSDIIGDTMQLEYCIKPCKGSPKIFLKTKGHLLIDCDYLGQELPLNRERQTYNRIQELKELPRKITFGMKKYQLTGLVHYRPGHYTAYVYRAATDCWECHDGLSRSIIKSVPLTEKVMPHILFFVLDN